MNRVMRPLVGVLCIMLGAPIASARLPYVYTDWQHFTVKDGLPNDHIFAVISLGLDLKSSENFIHRIAFRYLDAREASAEARPLIFTDTALGELHTSNRANNDFSVYA